MKQITAPFPLFLDRSGDPLDAGYVYIGLVNQNPETSPAAIFWDQAATQPAAQPLRTVAGRVVNGATPARVYVGSDDYSLTVKDKNGVTIVSVMSVESSGGLDAILDPVSPSGGAGLVAYGAGVDYPPKSAGGKLNELPVSLLDYGAPTDGTTSASDAFDAAIDAAVAGNGRIYINDNITFRITRNHTVPANVDVIFGKGGKFNLNGFDITFNGGVDVTSPDIRTGSGNIVLQNSRKNFLSHVLIRGRDDTGITNQDEILQMSTLAVIDNRIKITSSTSVTAGLGFKDFVIQPGGASSAWLATLGSGTPFYVYSAGVGTATQEYMVGPAVSFDTGTNTLRLDITNNTLPAGTYSDWVFGTDFPTIVFANYSGSDNLSPGCGLMGWVGNTSDTPPPYSYTLALYGGSGTIPTFYQKPNGKTGMGTEEPNERLHLVGNPSGTIPAAMKYTRALDVEHDYQEGFEDDANVWGGRSFVKISTVRPSAADDERYPGVTYPVNEYYRGQKVYDVYKILNQGATYQNVIDATTRSDAAACFVNIQIAGSTTGQGSWAVEGRFVATRAGGVLTVTQISQTVYGYGAAFGTPPNIECVATGSIIAVRLRGGLDAANVNPLTRTAYGTVEFIGCPTKGAGFINTVMS